ncbi:MAG: hypothetical protein KDN18_05015 [Verrucomicrobiae bacterium]|nr:hypothetical protein [Verrucomicrobiae bacterium]
MKNTIIALLVAIFLISLANLLAGLGIIGGGGAATGAHEYKVLNATQMDDIGFRAVAKEEGLEVAENGEIKFPKEIVDKIAKVNLLPRTILEVEKDGGWEFLSVTSDDHYVFRRAK